MSELLSAPVLGAAAWARVAHAGQRPPAKMPDGSDWRTWVFLGGRGAGKTRAGAEWVWAVASALGAGGRIALVAPTLHDARSVMVEGPSGVLNLPFRSGAVFEPSLRRVRFPGGALGLLFSAEEPERLRGPQFHAAWGDEAGAWGRGEEVLATLRLGLRLSSGAAVVGPSGPPARGGRDSGCQLHRWRTIDPIRPSPDRTSPMLALAAALTLQAQAYTPPTGPSSVEELRGMTQYITAVSMKAGLLRACSDFVDPGALEELYASLANRPEAAHLGEPYAAWARKVVNAPTNVSRFFDGGRPTEEKCRMFLGFADQSLVEREPAFRAALPAFVGRMTAAD